MMKYLLSAVEKLTSTPARTTQQQMFSEEQYHFENNEY